MHGKDSAPVVLSWGSASVCRILTIPQARAPFSLRPPPDPASRLRAGDLVRHSKLNSEHVPEPTQNIRNIIKQYQQPARAPDSIRSEEGTRSPFCKASEIQAKT